MLHVVVRAYIFSIQLLLEKSPWMMDVVLEKRCRDLKVTCDG